jgi:hypothetical protein
MVILLQMDSIKPRGHEVTFQSHFQGPNAEWYREITSPSQGSLGHYQYLNRPVYPLRRDQQVAYVATIQQILEFLEI